MLGGLQYGDQKLTPSFHTNVQRAKADSFTAPTPRTSSRKGRGSKTQPANDTKSAPTSRRATRASSIRSVNNDEPPVEAPLTEVGYPHHIFLSKARGRWPRLSVGVTVADGYWFPDVGAGAVHGRWQRCIIIARNSELLAGRRADQEPVRSIAVPTADLSGISAGCSVRCTCSCLPLGNSI